MRLNSSLLGLVAIPVIGSVFSLMLNTTIVRAEDSSPLPSIRLEKGVAVGSVARGGRRPFVADPVQLSLVQGTWQPPKSGDVVRLADGTERTYAEVQVDKDGKFESPAFSGGGYLYVSVDSPEERVYLLSAQGNNLVYVNGALYPGDPYGYSYLQLPVLLKKGTNHFLFTVGRGYVHAELLPVAKAISLSTGDLTLPDLRVDSRQELWAALPVTNATNKTQSGLTLKAEINGETVTTKLPALPPLSVRKLGFRVPQPKDRVPGSLDMKVSLVSDASSAVTIPIRVRAAGATYKQTFVSQIDGSVQYFGVNPAQKPSASNALVLSLHGASVEAIGQADAYSSKDWATLVAPTNRRPFGFDWEDWGRMDGMEVFRIAKEMFPHDPSRVVLTGHSMGGHGTWSVGSFFPDQFAAIGPSAGWISFDTYGGSTRPRRAATDKAPSPATVLLERAANIHDTLAFGTNLLQEKIYIVHGDADDNVPVEQARQMRAQLEAWKHPSVQWHEEKGAGHWWDASDAPGADCVDWKPMFDLFQSVRLSKENGANFMFTTVAPSASASCHWVVIEQQEHMMAPSIVRCTFNTGIATVTTENTDFLTVLPKQMPGDGNAFKQLQIDGDAITLSKPGSAPLHLRRANGKWQLADALAAQEKNPSRSGPFKQAFQNRFILVYPTGGTTEENAWGYARALYDAQTFMYRGNGSPEMIADKDYDTRAMRDRNVILYGNATINTLWPKLLKNCPIQVTRDLIRTKTKEQRADNLATAFLYPKPDSKTALIGAVGGTGMTGLRLTNRFPYFVSGAAFPDIVIADPTVLTSASDSPTLGAGYFDNTWQLGEFSW